MKKLPIGIQSFTTIREDNYLYVDKTADVYRMVSTGMVYFLSRPRRFGKSLLISTLDALFSGRKDLFEGLYIYDKWDWTRQRPVIRIDWTRISHRTPEAIEIRLSGYLRSIAKSNGITLSEQYDASDCLDELIANLYEKTGERVVVLIDEYDVPILDVMGKSHEELRAIQDKLHDIYKALKGAADYLQFVLLTGVSKFAGLSIFSALNNLTDISLDKKYAAICGYTQQELESNFPEYLAETAAEMSKTPDELLAVVRRWYNGYSWDGKTSVYNPFGILLFLNEKKFKNYWFATGTPTFLIELLKKRNHIDAFLYPIQAKESIFSAYDPERLETIPLLFQTGYLTIKDAAMDDVEWIYTLAIPNREVENSFVQNLFTSYTHLHLDEMLRVHESMVRQIKTCDAAGLAQSLRAMIAHVPYQLHIEAEKYYHSLLLVWLYFMGFKAQGEIPTNIGRIDAVWQLPDMTVVAEVKYSAEQPLEKLLDEAMAQIHDRKYYEAYTGKKVVLLAVAFAGREIGCRCAAIK